MSSQFDDLLGDFGDTSGSATIKAGGDSHGAEDSGMLLDFSVETEATNGQTNGVGTEMDSSASANPLYDLSGADDSQLPSYNPLYDFEDANVSSSSGNPLYDFDVTTDTNTSASTGNPLYDLATDEPADDSNQQQQQDSNSALFDLNDDTEVTTTTTSSANPLFDFDASVGVDEGHSEGQDNSDLLGDFNSNQQQETLEYAHQDQSDAGIREYSESDVNGGDALLDLGPTDTNTEDKEEIITTTYEEPEEETRSAEPFPDLIVTEDGDEETKAETAHDFEFQPEHVEQAESAHDLEFQPEHVEQAEAAHDLEFQPEHFETETAQDVEFQPEHIEADDSQYVEVQPEEIDAQYEERDNYKDRIEGDGEEQEEHQAEQQTDTVDHAANEGEYHADRREEDLEQYCLYREEETSEVSDGIGEAAVPEERDQAETEEARTQEVDQSDYAHGQTDDQESVAAYQAQVPEVEKEEEIIPVAETAEFEQEEEVIQDGHTVTKTTHTENRYSTGSGFEDSQPSQKVVTSNVIDDTFSKQNEPVMKSEPTPPQAAPRTQSQSAPLYDDDDESEEEGVYENEPEKRADVFREADKTVEDSVPAVGTASNLRAKFLANQEQAFSPRPKREITPPNPTLGGGEYVSEPRMQLEQYEGKSESGVFESQPVIQDDIVRSGTQQEEAVPEQGFAKNVAARFKQLESEQKVYKSGKKEITPDRSGRSEYVSEPRGTVEHYEGKSESGVFESEPALNPDVVRSGEGLVEELPEVGTAKSMAARFRQISEDNSSPAASRGKRELTPDTSGRVEYVSEPRGHFDAYEPRTESGVFENQPQEESDVVKSASLVEEHVPERGYTKNVAALFKEMESNAKSPPLSPGRRKEFTPPREDATNRQSGVYESTPQSNAEVVSSSELTEEVLPERGTARNIAQRFRQLEAENKSPPAAKPKKEFTPPPHEAGVYENQPDHFQADYNRPAESGILENNPETRNDLSKESEPPKYTEELPERGSARNLLSRWKQMETESAKSPGSGKNQKEFTPPREEPRIAQQSKSPRTPKSPSANGSMDNGAVHPSELPGQYQPQNEASVVESTPDEQRSDVSREGDTDWSQGMPKKNTAKKMLARFQSMQSDASSKESSQRESRKESVSESESSSSISLSTNTSVRSTTSDEVDPAMQSARLKFEDPDKVGRSKSMRAAIQVEKCGACEKTVYAMERLEMNKQVYHRACFRCSQCKSVLTPKTFAINNDVIFCTTHYKQLFTRKGNYDEGFGRSQHKTRWNSNPNIAEACKQEDAADASRSQAQLKS